MSECVENPDQAPKKCILERKILWVSLVAQRDVVPEKRKRYENHDER